jgi:hypothetical protein
MQSNLLRLKSNHSFMGLPAAVQEACSPTMPNQARLLGNIWHQQSQADPGIPRILMPPSLTILLLVAVVIGEARSTCLSFASLADGLFPAAALGVSRLSHELACSAVCLSTFFNAKQQTKLYQRKIISFYRHAFLSLSSFLVDVLLDHCVQFVICSSWN